MIKTATSDKLTYEYCFDRVNLHIIPVIDLLNGICVHAKKGQRSRYLPLTSSLTKSKQPLDIVKAFMDTYPFKTLYIADLNAIQTLENTSPHHAQTIESIKHHFPDLKLWVDAGINTVKKAEIWVALGAQVILGSESFQTIEQYDVMSKQLDKPFTLSLDFLAQGYTGPSSLLEQTMHWPKDIIIMTLAKVGGNAGVDVNMIKKIIGKGQLHHFYAAGGIRHLDDLQQLVTLKVKGALVASALHSQQISTQELEQLAT
ncbi:MAG: HisA/HisF-related TIM barrel protein [Methylophilaceae bacterium]